MEVSLIAIFTGAIVGWLGSLVMRTDEQSGILADIGVGAFSGLIAALALGNDYLLDGFLAAALGAAFIVGALALVRRTEFRR